jgi:hypothetical protein
MAPVREWAISFENTGRRSHEESPVGFGTRWGRQSARRQLADGGPTPSTPFEIACDDAERRTRQERMRVARNEPMPAQRVADMSTMAQIQQADDFLTTAEAAVYLKFVGRCEQPERACYEFLRSARTPRSRAGRIVLWRRADLDATVARAGNNGQPNGGPRFFRKARAVR